MNSNLNIRFDSNNPFLTWQSYPDSISYNIFRGTNKDNLVKIKTTSLLQFKDAEVNIMDKFDRTNYYYQIASIDKDNNETKFTDIITHNTDIDYPYKGFVNEIIRRNSIVLDRIAGEPVDIYLQKGAGERCIYYNQVTKNHDREDELCDICYNTSFVGGFEKVSCNVRILNAKDAIEQTPYGIKISANKECKLSIYPIVTNGDFIKRQNGHIYLIDDVKHKEFRGQLHSQVATISLLLTTHKYYTIN